MILYAVIGAIGLLFLLVMLFVGEIFGGDHDFGGDGDGQADFGHEGGPSLFSGRVMAAFLTAFGMGGIVARYYELPHPAASGVGVAAGIVFAGIVYQFAKLLYGQQASSEVRMNSLLGQPAEVTVGIPEGGLGQVTLVVGGERTMHIARSSNGLRIPSGASVVITALRGDSVVVEPAAVSIPGGTP